MSGLFDYARESCISALFLKIQFISPNTINGESESTYNFPFQKFKKKSIHKKRKEKPQETQERKKKQNEKESERKRASERLYPNRKRDVIII